MFGLEPWARAPGDPRTLLSRHAARSRQHPLLPDRTDRWFRADSQRCGMTRPAETLVLLWRQACLIDAYVHGQRGEECADG